MAGDQQLHPTPLDPVGVVLADDVESLLPGGPEDHVLGLEPGSSARSVGGDPTLVRGDRGEDRLRSARRALARRRRDREHASGPSPSRRAERLRQALALPRRQQVALRDRDDLGQALEAVPYAASSSRIVS